MKFYKISYTFFSKVNTCFGFIFSLDNTVKMTFRRDQADWLTDPNFKEWILRNIETH